MTVQSHFYFMVIFHDLKMIIFNDEKWNLIYYLSFRFTEPRKLKTCLSRQKIYHQYIEPFLNYLLCCQLLSRTNIKKTTLVIFFWIFVWSFLVLTFIFTFEITSFFSITSTFWYCASVHQIELYCSSIIFRMTNLINFLMWSVVPYS